MLDFGILGTPRKHPDACSKCGAEIADDHVPLMLFADGRNLMFVYCLNCEEGLIFRLYKSSTQERSRNGEEEEIQTG